MTTERKGDWIQTFIGNKFYIVDPRAEDVDIRDIAHSLAMKCRYGGHSRFFYSVAEHSVILSHVVPANLALQALLHDAGETYTGDPTRPYKNSLREQFGDAFDQIEAVIDAAISEKFGLPWPLHELIKEYDTRLLGDEREVLMHNVLPWTPTGDRLMVHIRALAWQDAEQEFLARFDELVKRPTTKAPVFTRHVDGIIGVPVAEESTPIPKFLREPVAHRQEPT